MSNATDATVDAAATLRSRIYLVLEGPALRMKSRAAVRVLLVGAIVASVAGAVLQTVHSLSESYGWVLYAVQWSATLVFAIEYLIRLWLAPEHVEFNGTTARRARIAYLISSWGVVDLLAVVCLPLSWLTSPSWGEVVLLVRLLKFARYLPSLGLFATVLRHEAGVLLGALLTMCVLLTLAASIMCVLEHDAQPTVFDSIPHAMWWAIVTMGTVGYGDMVPVTPGGRIFGSLVIVMGMAMFAVPAGIMAAGFAQELRRRNQMITWQAVARVPLFAELDAARIADIARLLKLDVLPAGRAVVRRGEPADAVFFIVSGQVEVDTAPKPRRLGRGQFFGEIALLHDVPRTATVTTRTECRLLVLDAADFRRMLDTHPRIRQAIEKVARERMS